MKDKNAAIDCYLKIIYKSWTWDKLTEEERNRFIDQIDFIIRSGHIKGNFARRCMIMGDLYSMFLYGIGYTNENWRINDSEPLF